MQLKNNSSTQVKSQSPHQDILTEKAKNELIKIIKIEKEVKRWFN